MPVNLFLRRGKFTRSYIYDYFQLNLLRYLSVRLPYDLLSFMIRLRDIALDKIKKLLFQELYEMRRHVADIAMCHENYSTSRKIKKRAYGW